ncbi:hypothetical protein JQ629_20080 [Bradyrhizobium sp. AUGA SZCCT0222]|uniref:hypothetical protein n=1 Tax=Bradyrhizobium sp. AUGA SZCCT0222 TaxID=2807668 RepID=UPI001BA60E81|nr:hypothetical protein [Bradyrhizobium sp. AUGA SZCCT0222]MBR1269816.1 hypothetical protein [Bradyrhizobium sp. AUGA SZCCT0222]
MRKNKTCRHDVFALRDVRVPTSSQNGTRRSQRNRAGADGQAAEAGGRSRSARNPALSHGHIGTETLEKAIRLETVRDHLEPSMPT